MKKIFLLLSFSMLCMISFAQQQVDDNREFEISGISTAEAIKGFADSMRLSYPYYEIEWIGMDSTANSVTYIFRDLNGRIPRISVKFPVIWDEPTTRSVFNIADSLARTDIYNNKVIANTIFCALAKLGGRGDWQTEIAIKAVKQDMDYSAKFTYSQAVASLPKSLFSQDIIDLIAKKFSDPYITREEAEIIVKGRRPTFDPVDTTGYAKLQDKYMTNTITADEKSHYRFLDGELRELKYIQSRGQTIQQYTDSLNGESYELHVNRLTGQLWGGCLDIIDYAQSKRIYSLAPLIESFATPEIRERRDIDFTLARLKYKDYYRQQDEKYANILDSCIVFLKNNPELGASDEDVSGRIKVQETALKMIDSYNSMVYLGVSDLEILDRLMPIVTIKKPTIGHFFIFGGGGEQVSIGTYFLSDYIMEIVTNVPVPENMKIWDWDKNDIPAKMYKWLLENKNNYQLRQRSDEE